MSEIKHARCTMGMGCDVVGACYADAVGHPEKCPAAPAALVAELVEGISVSDIAVLDRWIDEADARGSRSDREALRNIYDRLSALAKAKESAK